MPSTSRDHAWLGGLCASRASFSLIITVYSATMPLVVVDWGMSAAQAGLVQSAWHVGSLVSLFAIGFLSDRYGAKRMFLASGFAATASACLFAAFADGFLSALLLYGLAGLCSGGSYTPGLTLISQRFAAARGRAMGFYLAAASVGYALSLVLSGLVTPHFGWRGAYVMAALGPVLGSAIAFWTLRAGANVVHPPATPEARGHPVREVLANRPALLSIFAYAFHTWELVGIKTWLPAFLAAAAVYSGMSMVDAASLAALLTALGYVASAAGGVAGGALSDRLGRTRTILIASCASLACSFTFGWLFGLPLWLLVAIACLYLFAAIADSSVYSTAATELVPPRLIGATYSVRSVIGLSAGALSPWALGAVIDFARDAGAPERLTWGLAWCVLGAGAALGPLMTWRLRHMPEAARMAGGLR